MIESHDRFSHESLGEPSVQSHATVNSVTGHIAPYLPIVDGPHHGSPPHPLVPYIPPICIPYSHPIFYTQTPYMPYTYHAPATYIPPTMLVC